jgi:acetyl-CoA C-acetyltransferase
VTDAYVYDAIRTPRGKGKNTGSLHTVKPVSLVTGLMDAMRERNESLDFAEVDDVVLGVVEPHGEQGGSIARTAAIAAGLPEPVAGVQLNRYCGSGLEAVNQAAARVRSGWDELILAGGVESMSRVPMASGGDPWAMDPETNYATSFVPQGISADLIATTEGYSREDVDAFALESQIRAGKAWADGRFERSVIPVKDLAGRSCSTRTRRSAPTRRWRRSGRSSPPSPGIGEMGGFDAVALQKYTEVEAIEHVHHAGNSSGIVDGASLVLLGSKEAGDRNGLTPRARIRAAPSSAPSRPSCSPARRRRASRRSTRRA